MSEKTINVFVKGGVVEVIADVDYLLFDLDDDPSLEEESIKKFNENEVPTIIVRGGIAEANSVPGIEISIIDLDAE